MRRIRLSASVAVIAAILAAVPSASAGPAAQPRYAQRDLKRLSLEELMQIDVTTTTRRPEPVGTAAAAVFVITSDDLRRSGITTIPDALALADGLHVARFNNGSWQISARGFNGSTPNKLLVMVDGRTVYTPLFAGVFWNTVDYVLEDIDRIEVIRGPGATLWGANAVNGVINIITRHSRDTRGAYVNVAAGNEDHGIVETRYGGGRGDLSWRVYGKFAERDAQRFADGTSSDDARRRGQAGFRVDGGTGAGNNWLLIGNAYHSGDDLPAQVNAIGPPTPRAPAEFTDLSLQGRWSWAQSATSRVTLQSYYRREYRRVPLQLTHHIDIVDLDAQQAVTLAREHAIVWGGGVRVNDDATFGSATFSFNPAARTYPVANVFVQDEFTVVPRRLTVTAGLKYEHNAFSGGELQPNVRARLQLARNQTLWGAVSRAVRRPTRIDDNVEVRAGNGLLLVTGTGEFKAETLIATELGYRVQPIAALSLDATLFVHDFNDLRSQDAPPAGGLPLTIGNTLRGQSHGLELGVNIQPAAWWRTHVGYTWLDTSIERQPGSRDLTGGTSEMNDPHYILALSSALDLPKDVEFNAQLRAIDELPNPAVPAYQELRLRLGWTATPTLELWVVGDDLLHDHHPEYGAAGPKRVEFERAVRVGTTMRF